MKIKIFICFIFFLTSTILTPYIASAEEIASQNYDEYISPIDPNVESLIKEDYIEYLYFSDPINEMTKEEFSEICKKEDTIIREHYGPFENAYILSIIHEQEVENFEYHSDDVAGYSFLHKTGPKGYMVWKDRKFYSLSEAYENNIINGNDIYILFTLSPRSVSKLDLQTSLLTQASYTFSDTTKISSATHSITETESNSQITQPETTSKPYGINTLIILLILLILISTLLFLILFFLIKRKKLG